MELKLGAYSAGAKREIFDALVRGDDPPVGRFDLEVLRAGREKGEVQMGTTVYMPGKISLEFIFQDPTGAATVFVVEIDPPERIVYMPVPRWVVEQIWEGEVLGSFVFENEARAMVAELEMNLSQEGNAPLFERAGPKRKA